MLINPPEVIQLLAHNLRWNIVKALSSSDYRVHELVNQLNQPMNLVSYHLKLLRDGLLIESRRSSADGRDIYYSLNLNHLRTSLQAVEKALSIDEPSADNLVPIHAIRVLFICTHNSARSQMAETLMRNLSGGNISVYSAGNQPTTIHPDAIKTMSQMGIDVSNQKSTHISQFEGQSFDYVITVCDNAREVCPTFTGSKQLHWGFTDPAAIHDANERLKSFEQIALRLKLRIEHFLKELT